MKRIQYHNEKGNVLPKVRAAQKAQALKEVYDTLMKAGASVTVAPKGLAIPYFQDENGETVYAQIEITMVYDLSVKEKSKAVKEDAPIEVASMFE